MIEAKANQRISGQPLEFHTVVTGFADPKCTYGESLKSRIHFGEKVGDLGSREGFYCRSESPPARLQFCFEISVTDAGHVHLRRKFDWRGPFVPSDSGGQNLGRASISIR